MKVFYKGIKGKGKDDGGGAGGDVFLTPPATTDKKSSIAVLNSLEAVSEGPIEGIVKSDGSKALGVDVLEGVFYDDVRVKEPTPTPSSNSQLLKFENIELMDRCSVSSLSIAVDNIITGIKNLKEETEYPKISTFCQDYIDRLTEEKNKFIPILTKQQNKFGHLGIIQYNYSGLFEAPSNIYGKSNELYSTEINFGENQQLRQIENYNETILSIPNALSFVVGDYEILEEEQLTGFISGGVTYPAEPGDPFPDGSGLSGRPDLGESHEDPGRVGLFYELSGIHGGGIDFFYIGDEIATGAGGEFLTGKFLVETSDSSFNDYVESGRENNYDVFAYSNDEISLAAAPSTQKSPAIGESVGNRIKLQISENYDQKFNYTNASIEQNLGSESQEPLNSFSSIKRDIQINQRILGPFVYGGSAQAGNGNEDVRTFVDQNGYTQRNYFATWQVNLPEETDEFSYTHTITDSQVDDLIVTLVIEQLRDTVASGENKVGRDEEESVDITLEYGFEGDNVFGQSVSGQLEKGYSLQNIYLNQLKQTQTETYEGIIRSPYLTDVALSNTLPKNKDLNNKTADDINGLTSALKDQFNIDGSQVLFPGRSWEELNRYIKIRKNTFETESILIFRNVSVGQVTEVIESNFSYPSVALVGNKIDARTFNQVPTRTYDMRLKKVLIPSNYNPLFANGVDRRFIDDVSKYGLRDIYKFNGTSYFKAQNKIDLGTENCEFLVKVKFGSFVDWRRIFDGYVNGSATEYIALWYQDYNTTHGIQSKILDGDSNSSNYIEINIADYVPGGSKYNADNVFEISLKLIGTKQTLTVWVNGELVGTSTEDNNTTNPRKYLVFDAEEFCIGGNKNSGHRIPNGSKIADLKIKKNNQLLHHWDGTIIETANGKALKDRFGGNHAKLVGTFNTTEEDTDFEFGKNREQIYIGEWDGTFKLAWTDNPAWILYDLMINPIYGIGSKIDDLEDIDIFNLYLIGRYCDGVDEEGYFDGVPDDTNGLEPRFSCNVQINKSENAFIIIGNVASIFRAMTFWENGSFNFSIDKEKEISAIFNNANVFDGIFNYSDIANTARFTRVEVLYSDKKDNFTLKKEYVEDEESIRKYGLITKEELAIGCTSKSQARRLGKYILFSNKMETEIVSFSAGAESLFLSPGSLIRIDDELKNFEINYGTVLNLNTGSNPFVEIENITNTGSIQTGSSGGIYLFSNREQEEIKNLYEIVNFNKSYTGISEDGDIYEQGALELEKLENIRAPQINKFTITGFESQTNSNRLLLDPNQDGFDYITGVRVGSKFNVELNNNVDNYYKVIKISERDQNLYDVQAIEFDSRKFDLIEDVDIDLTENAYGIGAPKNTINAPSEPAGYSTGASLNNIGGYDFSGIITGQIGGTETKYRVSLNLPNGKYEFKDFLKDETLTPPQTEFLFKNLNYFGDYKVQVTSLRNPESSISLEKSFYLSAPNKVRNNFIIDDIKIKTNDYQFFQSGSGSGIQTDENLVFDIKMKDFVDNYLYLDSSERPYIKVSLIDETGSLIRILDSNLRSNPFVFSKQDNIQNFNEIRRNYNIKFELYNREGLLNDYAVYNIKNPIPEILQVNFDGSQNDEIKFNFSFDSNTSKDIDKIEVYKATGFESAYELFYTENFPKNSLKLSRDLFLNSGVYETGLNFYKFLPFDDFSSGQFSNITSGYLNVTQIEEVEEVDNEEEQYKPKIETIYFANGVFGRISNSSNNQSGAYLIGSGNLEGFDVKYLFETQLRSQGSGVSSFEIWGPNNFYQEINRFESQRESEEFYASNFVKVPNSGNYYFSVSDESGIQSVDFSISIDELINQNNNK